MIPGSMKFYLVAGGLALALLVAGGCVWWILGVVHDNEVLTLNNAKLEDAHAEQSSTIDSMVEDAKVRSSQLTERRRQVARLGMMTRELKGELNAIAQEDQAMVDCLNVVPSDHFIDRLRQASRGQADSED